MKGFKWLTWRSSLIFAFIFFNLTDIATTFLAGGKHGYDYEINPVFVITGSIYLMILVKLVLSALLVYMIVWMYKRYEWASFRYVLVYFMVLFTIMLAFLSYSNFLFYQISPEEIGPPIATKEEKIDVMVNVELADLNILKVVGPQEKKMPLLYILFGLNMLQFIIWRSFEVHGWKGKCKKQQL